jgi:hypothetical protein
MPKKETETQIERTPQTQDIMSKFAKLYKDLSKTTLNLIDDIKHEINWLEQYSNNMIEKCESEWGLALLMEFKNKLEKTRNELRYQSYSLSCGSDYTKYLYDEITEDEYMRTL